MEHIISTKLASDYVFVAAKKHKNVDSLFAKILQHSRSLLSQQQLHLPKYYSNIATTVRSLQKSGRILCSTKENFVHSSTSCFFFFHDIGYIIFNNPHQLICVNPSLLSKSMAYIINPSEHREIMAHGEPFPPFFYTKTNNQVKTFFLNQKLKNV